MNRLDALAKDPRIFPFLKELMEKVDRRNREIFEKNKKGIALARTLKKLPDVRPSSADVTLSRIRVGSAKEMDAAQRTVLRSALYDLKPWRKGPFEIFGIPIDSEWDSSIKWDRLAGHLGDMTGKRILDIGASCGYYMFRMAHWNPQLIMGIEPYLNFYFQFLALQRYLAMSDVHCLPMKLEELPAMRRCFDTVLCMGILYHRRSPLDTLLQIHRMMMPGGRLVVETLVLEDEWEMALFPRKRYAKMKNIFFIPTVPCLTHWLERSGFTEIQCVDVTRTTVQEQRKTDWIDTESLPDFLDPEDSRKTVEGYPAPVRAMVLATAALR